MNHMILWILLPLLVGALVLPLLRKHVWLVKAIFLGAIGIATFMTWMMILQGEAIANTRVVFGAFVLSSFIEWATIRPLPLFHSLEPSRTKGIRLFN